MSEYRKNHRTRTTGKREPSNRPARSEQRNRQVAVWKGTVRKARPGSHRVPRHNGPQDGGAGRLVGSVGGGSNPGGWTAEQTTQPRLKHTDGPYGVDDAGSRVCCRMATTGELRTELPPELTTNLTGIIFQPHGDE